MTDLQIAIEFASAPGPHALGACAPATAGSSKASTNAAMVRLRRDPWSTFASPIVGPKPAGGADHSRNGRANHINDRASTFRSALAQQALLRHRGEHLTRCREVNYWD
jgi:hypothetical protein